MSSVSVRQWLPSGLITPLGLVHVQCSPWEAGSSFLSSSTVFPGAGVGLVFVIFTTLALQFNGEFMSRYVCEHYKTCDSFDEEDCSLPYLYNGTCECEVKKKDVKLAMGNFGIDAKGLIVSAIPGLNREEE